MYFLPYKNYYVLHAKKSHTKNVSVFPIQKITSILTHKKILHNTPYKNLLVFLPYKNYYVVHTYKKLPYKKC